VPAQVCYVIMYVEKFESHVQIANLCAPRKITNSAENLVLQALQFQELGVYDECPGGANISYYRFNECFMEGQFNVSS
jgi:hypothetical protein